MKFFVLTDVRNITRDHDDDNDDDEDDDDIIVLLGRLYH